MAISIIHNYLTNSSNIISRLKNDIGVVEDGSTATNTILQGQYVVWGDNLYIAKTAIPAGTALSGGSGGNLTRIYDGGLNSVNDDIKTLENRITVSTIVQNYKHITADTWENTKVSVTVPSGKLYLVSAYIAWSGGRPTGIGFTTDASGNTPSAALMTDGGNSSVQFSGSYMLNSGTYYVCEKRNSANVTNAITIYYLSLN